MELEELVLDNIRKLDIVTPMDLMSLDLAHRIAESKVSVDSENGIDNNIDDLINGMVIDMINCVRDTADDDGGVELDKLIRRYVEVFDARSMMVGMKLLVEYLRYTVTIISEKSHHRSVMMQKPETN